MRRRDLVGALAVLGVVRATGAWAGIAPRAMLMPVVRLKQVARGFGPLPGHGFHTGLDLTAPYGAPVRAAAAGRVVFAGTYYGYGRMIDIRHPDGLVTRYAHLSAFAPGLRPGTEVAAGGVIGAVGTSGHAHGPHLHFEVRVADRPVDPRPYLGLAPAETRPPVIEAGLHGPHAAAPVAAFVDDRPHRARR